VSSDRRPRVLHVGPDFPGGMNAVIAELLASPLAEHYRLEILATFTARGKVRRLVVFAVAVLRLAAWCGLRRGPIVHVHATVRGSMLRKAVCVLLARALGRRVVLHVHSGPGDIESFRRDLGTAGTAYVSRAFAAADVVLAVSSRSARILREAFGRGEIEVLPNPAPPLLEPAPGVRAGSPRALFIGGFENPVKGGSVILAALARSWPAGLEVVLAGPGTLPPEGARLIAASPGLSWQGWLTPNEKRELLERASIFVLASTSEGLPVALLEAMSAGLAIAAADVGGVPDILTDGRDALFVPPGDADALADALARLATDAELRGRLGAAARERAAGLDRAEIAARIERIYSRLLAGPSSQAPDDGPGTLPR